MIDKVYAEVHVANMTGKRAVFPAHCPVCGAKLKGRENVGRPWERVHYVCGGSYLPKPQIQNHTNKWWGQCGR